MAIREIKQEEFEQAIAQDFCLVDVYGRTCGPCQVLGGILEELSAKRPDMNIIKLCADDSMQIVRKYRIMGVPFLLFFKNGEKVKSLVGVQTAEDLEKVYDELKA